MSSRRRDRCRKGLHDLRDPENACWRTRPDGVAIRYCLPCRRLTERAYKQARRRKQGVRPRGTGCSPAAVQLAALQRIADGLTPAEAGDADGATESVIEHRLLRVRRRYGVTSTAAAVYAALLRGDITPVRRTKHPMPPNNNTTRNHARSVAALLRGERRPSRGGAAHRALLDDLYAFTEAHAVSVLWAARMITRDGTPRWKEPDMTDHATAA